jgi:hypothetical protein
MPHRDRAAECGNARTLSDSDAVVGSQGTRRATQGNRGGAGRHTGNGSGLMAALERDSLVTSAVASDDRRNLLASLTRKGEATVEKAIETNRTRLRAAFTLSADELTALTTLLERVRQGFSGNAAGAERRGGSHDGKGRRAMQMNVTPGVA